MSEEYRFFYNGTKEMLLHQCNQCRYINEYIISTLGGEIKFGIGRAGHCAGYWFIPTICESDNGIELVGTIQYIGPEDNRDSRAKRKDKIVKVVATIILFPLICISKFVDFVKKITNKTPEEPKPKTKEEKLFDLMINHFGCTEV